MKKVIFGSAILLTASVGMAMAQTPPKKAFDITQEQIQQVLKFAPPAVDQQLMVVDIGKYNLAVGIIHRGKTGGAARAGGGRQGAGRQGGGAGRAQANVVRCGPAQAPAGAAISAGSLISHDQELETYQIVSGDGDLITGGTIFNGVRSGPESEVTKILNGPSCSGFAFGDFVTRHVKVGDVVIIPPGVGHGWTNITDHVDYLSVRPDPDHVLPAGYVNPHITEMGK